MFHNVFCNRYIQCPFSKALCPFINTKALSLIELLTVKLKLTCLSQVLTVQGVIMDTFLYKKKDRSRFHIYELIHSLATLLGTPCHTRLDPPFAFRTAFNFCGIDSTRCWKYSSEILVHIYMIASHSCCRFVGCTSMMWNSRSTTSQRCSVGLRSGDCGGHLSKVNSLSCSRNQSEMIWALWHGALSSWK